jgi:DNA-directed RNA polymerase specialized sigma24 family protein
LYAEHRLGLVRLAVLLVGDQRLAEDLVQDAFVGLVRHWSGLREPGQALSYARASVVNGARGALRRRARWRRLASPYEPPIWSAESAALLGEDRRAVMAALRRLPPGGAPSWC